MIELKDFSRDYICIYSLKYKKYLQLNNQFILSIPLTPTSSQPLDYFFFFLKVFFPPFLMFDGNFLFICVKIIRRALLLVIILSLLILGKIPSPLNLNQIVPLNYSFFLCPNSPSTPLLPLRLFSFFSLLILLPFSPIPLSSFSLSPPSPPLFFPSPLLLPPFSSPSS